MPLPTIPEIHTTWINPRDGDLGFYRVREGTMEILKAGKAIRCTLKEIHGDDDDFEVTIRNESKGLVLMFDYDDEPTTLPLEQFQSPSATLFYHESAKHLIYMRIPKAG